MTDNCVLSVPLDTLLRRLLKDLQQQAEVDHLGPLKFEEMADSIAGVKQSDLAEGSQDSHGRGAEGPPREQADAPEAVLQGDLPLFGSFAAGWPQAREEVAGGAGEVRRKEPGEGVRPCHPDGKKPWGRQYRKVVRQYRKGRALWGGEGESYSPGHNAFFLLERWIYVKDFFFICLNFWL